MILIGDTVHARQIARMAGTGFDPEVDQVISRVTAEGNFWGGLIYTNYTGVAIQVHMAGVDTRWGSPGFLWFGFDYPFMQLKVEQILATVPSTNQRALDIDLRLGFKEVARIPRAVKDGDMIVLSMSRDECKWLKLRKRFLRDPEELAT